MGQAESRPGLLRKIRNSNLVLLNIEVSFTYSSEEIKKLAVHVHQKFQRANSVANLQSGNLKQLHGIL